MSFLPFPALQSRPLADIKPNSHSKILVFSDPTLGKYYATTYEQKGFWATQPLAKILVREILLCEPGVILSCCNHYVWPWCFVLGGTVRVRAGPWASSSRRRGGSRCSPETRRPGRGAVFGSWGDKTYRSCVRWKRKSAPLGRLGLDSTSCAEKIVYTRRVLNPDTRQARIRISNGGNVAAAAAAAAAAASLRAAAEVRTRRRTGGSGTIAEADRCARGGGQVGVFSMNGTIALLYHVLLYHVVLVVVCLWYVMLHYIISY